MEVSSNYSCQCETVWFWIQVTDVHKTWYERLYFFLRFNVHNLRIVNSNPSAPCNAELYSSRSLTYVHSFKRNFSNRVNRRESANQLLPYLMRIQGSTVSILTVLRVESTGGQSQGQGFPYFFHHRIQTESGAHPASYRIHTDEILLRR
jgi:arabinogalactan endo-1,4-beta-galactosidase